MPERLLRIAEILDAAVGSGFIPPPTDRSVISNMR